MKKIIYLFCLICTITLAKGQYYRPDRGFLPGINAGYFYPTGDMGKILKNGIRLQLFPLSQNSAPESLLLK